MVDITEVKTILEDQGKAWDEFKKTNDDILAAKAEGKSVADLEVKLANLSKSLDQIEELKSQIGDLAKRTRPGMSEKGEADLESEIKSFNAMRQSGAAGQVKGATEEEFVGYRKAFFDVIRKSDKMMTPEEHKAMQVGIDSDGGYLVPPAATGRIIKRLYDFVTMRRLASVVSISTDALEGIVDRDEVGYGWVGETQPRPDTDTPELGKYRLQAHEMYASPKATQKLLDDAAIDIEGWLATKVADKFARVENDAFINGNGVNMPRGLFTYPTATTDDASRAWGTFQHVTSGTNGSFANADMLFDLIGKLKGGYLQSATFLTRREAVTSIRKLKESTTNAYMWQPGLQQGQPDRLLGYPIEVDQDIPALASGSLSMALGDFAEAYTIVDRIGIRTLRDPYTDKPYVKFYSTRRVGGGAISFDAVKFVKFST